MRSPISEDHRLDADGNPAGGTTDGRGFHINWQDGPLVDPETSDRREPDGAFVEDVIAAAVGRLEFYNEGKFRCRENSLAITHLQEAMHWLQHRTADRVERGVEGTHEA